MSNEPTILQDLALALTAKDARAAAERYVAEGLGYFRPFADNINYRTAIKNSGSAVSKLPERVQNAQDARIQFKAVQAQMRGEIVPETPREAVRQLFGLPHLGEMGQAKDPRIAKIEEKKLEDEAWEIIVACTNGNEHSNLTVRDFGWGQESDRTRSTFEGIFEGHKTHVPFVSGKYGHGAAQLLRFSDSALVLTRRQPELLPKADLVTFVFTKRVLWTKEQPAHWMTLVDNNGQHPTMPAEELLYWDFKAEASRRKRELIWTPGKPVPFAPGTAATNFEYSGLSPHLCNSNNNSPVRDLERLIPDPLLPFTIVDLRSIKASKSKASKSKASKSKASKSRNKDGDGDSFIKGGPMRRCTGVIPHIMRNMRYPDRLPPKKDGSQNKSNKLNSFESFRRIPLVVKVRDNHEETINLTVVIAKRRARPGVPSEWDDLGLKPFFINDNNGDDRSSANKRKGRYKPLVSFIGENDTVTVVQDTFTVATFPPSWYSKTKTILDKLHLYLLLYIDLSNVSPGLQGDLVSSDRALGKTHPAWIQIQKAIWAWMSKDQKILACAEERYKASESPNLATSAVREKPLRTRELLRTPLLKISEAKSRHSDFPGGETAALSLVIHTTDFVRVHEGGTFRVRLGCNLVWNGPTNLAPIPQFKCPANVVWTEGYGEIVLSPLCSYKDLPAKITITVMNKAGTRLSDNLELLPLPKRKPPTKKGGGGGSQTTVVGVPTPEITVTATILDYDKKPCDWPKGRQVRMSLNDLDPQHLMIDLTFLNLDPRLANCIRSYNVTHQKRIINAAVDLVTSTCVWRVDVAGFKVAVWSDRAVKDEFVEALSALFECKIVEPVSRGRTQKMIDTMTANVGG